MTAHPLALYTREVLSFSLGPVSPDPAAPEDRATGQSPYQAPYQAPDQASTLAAALVTALIRSGRPHLILLGLGSGRTALALDRLLPEACRLAVCEPDPALARQVLSREDFAPLAGSGRTQVLADTSAWAVLLLLHLHGPDPGSALILENPELPPEAKKALRPLRRLLTRTRRSALDLTPDLAPDMAPDMAVETAALRSPCTLR